MSNWIIGQIGILWHEICTIFGNIVEAVFWISTTKTFDAENWKIFKNCWKAVYRKIRKTVQLF